MLPRFFAAADSLPPGFLHRPGRGLAGVLVPLPDDVGLRPAHGRVEPVRRPLRRHEHRPQHHPGDVAVGRAGRAGRHQRGPGGQPQPGDGLLLRLRVRQHRPGLAGQEPPARAWCWRRCSSARCAMGQRRMQVAAGIPDRHHLHPPGDDPGLHRRAGDHPHDLPAARAGQKANRSSPARGEEADPWRRSPLPRTWVGPTTTRQRVMGLVFLALAFAIWFLFGRTVQRRSGDGVQPFARRLDRDRARLAPADADNSLRPGSGLGRPGRNPVGPGLRTLDEPGPGGGGGFLCVRLSGVGGRRQVAQPGRLAGHQPVTGRSADAGRDVGCSVRTCRRRQHRHRGHDAHRGDGRARWSAA